MAMTVMTEFITFYKEMKSVQNFLKWQEILMDLSQLLCELYYHKQKRNTVWLNSKHGPKHSDELDRGTGDGFED